MVARRFLPGDGGSEPLEGMEVPPCRTHSAWRSPRSALAFGPVLGPEAPLIALGFIVGIAVPASKLGQRESVSGARARLLPFPRLFGGPVVGGVLMEGAIGFGASTIPILLPGFVAAAVGYLVFIGLGDWGGLHAQALTVPGLPPYTGDHLGDLSVAIAVGVISALLVVAVRRFAHPLVESKARLGMPLLLVLGGLAVGLLAQAAAWLGADSQDVLFSGQASVPAVVAQDSVSIVVILIVAKALAYAVSLGAGFRGGPVFPGIFLGIALATLPVIWFGTSPTLAVAVGAAAGMAAVTRMLLTPILFATLLVGPAGVEAVPAAVSPLDGL